MPRRLAAIKPASESTKLLEDTGIKVDDVKFIFIGRLVAFKGFHLVVRGFLQTHAINDKIKLLVCGEFDDLHESGLNPDEIVRFSDHEGISYIGWTNTVERYLGISDAVVFPSEREGVPVNLMEALSMGAPVVTCDSRGCRDVMKSPGTSNRYNSVIAR